MSARRDRLSSALARRLIHLYPSAWRARYAEEMLALVEDDPPRARGLLSLLAGAADAHTRPQRLWSEALAPSVRARLSVAALFCCWIALSLLGIGFQKETEDRPFLLARSHHLLLLLGEDAIRAGAALGAAAIAVGGLPLLFQALVRALRTRDRSLLALIALPPTAVLAFLVVSRLLVAVAPARGGGFPASFVIEILLPWQAAGLLCAGICALTPRAVMRRAEPGAAALRRAACAGVVVALAIALVALGLLIYAVALWARAPGLSAVSSGPVGASIGAMLTFEVLAAVGTGALALRSARRAGAAASELTVQALR